MFPARFTIYFRSLLTCVEGSEILAFSIDGDRCLPTLTSLCYATISRPSDRRQKIAHVLRACGHSKVGDTIVELVAVSVINLTNRPLTVVHRPSDTVTKMHSKFIDAIKRITKVVDRSSDLPTETLVIISDRVADDAGIGIVREQSSQFTDRR